jgi:hypothetical protein
MFLCDVCERIDRSEKLPAGWANRLATRKFKTTEQRYGKIREVEHTKEIIIHRCHQCDWKLT